MLYLLVTIAHYKQLSKVNQELLDAVENSLKAISERFGILWSPSKDGDSALPLGSEKTLEPRRALEFVFPVFAALQDKREELFGFNLLLAVLEEMASGAAARQLKGQLLACEEDEEIWIDGSAISLFAGLVESRRVGEFWKVLDRVLPKEPPREIKSTTWVQEGLVFQGFRAISEELSGKRKNRGLWVHGPVALDRKRIIDCLQRRLAGPALVQRFPRLYTLFERRSILHPFLNSLDPLFLPQVPHFLAPHERKVWDGLADLLWYLKPAARSGQPAPAGLAAFGGWPAGVPRTLAGDAKKADRNKADGMRRDAETASMPAAIELCPDHLSEDFFLAYQLYLSAYFRLLEENFLPAVFICEDLESYQPATLRALSLLLKDFSQKPSFVPILSCAQAEVPESLSFLDPLPLAVRPLRMREMGRLAAELYPGLRLPRKDWQRIRQAVKGKPVTFQHCLLFLKRRGLIGEQDGVSHWRASEGWEGVLPKRPLTFSWQVVNGLTPEQKMILYAIYLQQGLLDLWGLFRFLKALGIPESEAGRSLSSLEEYGLIHAGNHVVPGFPAFRKRLRKRTLESDPGIEERLIEHLIELWRAGSYSHRVLLFFLLVKARRTDTAIEVLTQLLKHKLDELDSQGVRIFLEQKHFRLNTSLGTEQQKSLSLLLGAVRIRHCLLAGNRKEAESAYLKAVDLGNDFQVNPMKGELFLQISRYLSTRGETNIALQWAKKALIQFQNSAFPAGERAATLELGSILLAEGRFAEALEYFTIAEQSFPQSISLEQLRLVGLRSVTLFTQGNLSRAQVEAARALALARLLKRREWELFLAFLGARVQFELGSYEEAVQGFQEALAVETLYPSPPARKVLYAWLARSYAYSNSTELAVRLLGELAENWEQCLFLAEAYFFSRDYSMALEFCGKALSMNQNLDSFPGERILWSDGFSDVEGRCFVLAKDGALALRLVQSLQAYLWGLQGSVERASEQLHAITRSGRIPEADPYQSLYHYCYACILPDVRQDELDDRLTVLNKALQLLQQRASRIEDSTLRWHYLNNNYWNAGLFSEARKRKLI